MPTRILYISRSADLAGSERQLALILRGLDRKRFEPLVLCPGEGSFTQLLRSAGEQVLVVPPLTGLRKLTFPLFVLPRLLRREGIDLIHLHATRFCSIGGRLARVPVVEAITMSRAIPQAFLSRRPWADRFFSSFPRVLLVPSQHQRDELIARGIPASKIHVLYNSVWPQLHTWIASPDRAGVRAELGLSSDTPLVGVFGRLEPQKGIADFLNAAALVAIRDERVHFLVCGEGGLREALLSHRDALGLQERVHFLGFQTEVYRWLTALDLSVQSSVWEPLSNHVIESMTAGIPIVATDVGGTAEAVLDERSGLLVPPGNPQRMAEAMVRLLNDARLRVQLGEEARRQAQVQFSPEQMAETVRLAYSHAVARGCPKR